MSKKSEPKPLPKTMSGLLRLAVTDARKLQKTKGYKLDMRVFVAKPAKVCRVCMAGAVMVRELGMRPPPRFADPEDSADRATEQALYAIDNMRLGEFAEAARELGAKISDYQAGRLSGYLEAYTMRAGRYPWEAYLKVADMLEEDGL